MSRGGAEKEGDTESKAGSNVSLFLIERERERQTEREWERGRERGRHSI